MLQKIIILIDFLLNKNAIDYPIAYSGNDCEELPKGHLFTVKKETYRDGHILYYIRWL